MALTLSLTDAKRFVSAVASQISPFRSRLGELTLFLPAALSSCLLLASAGCNSGISAPVSKTSAPAEVPSLGVDATSIAFGGVEVNTTATQQISLSSGASGLTINKASLTGASFQITGPSFPITLGPGETIALSVEFQPRAAGAVSGQLTLSTSAANGSTAISLSGTGTAPEVSLAWQAPDTADASVGFNVYRASAGDSTFQLLGASDGTQTNYTDATIASGEQYQYYVTTLDADGNESMASNTIQIAVP